MSSVGRTGERQALTVLSALHLLGRLVKPEKGPAWHDWRATRGWGWRSVVGIGVASKRVMNSIVGEQSCLTIYVKRKLPKSRLASDHVIPEKLFLQSTGMEVLTDVVEIKSPIVAHSASMIQPGLDVAHQQGDPGTLALLVRQGTGEDVLALSCSHVLARSGVGAGAGDFVEHPVLYTSQYEQNEFGRLTDTFTRLNSYDTFEEDIALAKVDVPFSAAMASNGTVVRSIYDSTPGFASTIRTSLQGSQNPDSPGSILSSNWSGLVQDMPFVGTVKFENLVMYSTASKVGDSGAAVLQQGTSTVLGLHVAGSTSDGVGLFIPLWPVFQRLQLRLVQ